MSLQIKVEPSEGGEVGPIPTTCSFNPASPSNKKSQGVCVGGGGMTRDPCPLLLFNHGPGGKRRATRKS